MKKILACALAAVLFAGCGTALTGNNDALAASVGSGRTSAASNSLNSKIDSSHIAPALSSVTAAGQNTGYDISPKDFADFVDFYEFGIPKDAEFPSLKYAAGEWEYYLDLLDPKTGEALFAELGYADLSLNVRKETVIIDLNPLLDGDSYELYPVTDEEIGYELFEGGFDDNGALRLSGNGTILYITDYFAWSGREYIRGETWYSEEDYGIFLMTRGQR